MLANFAFIFCHPWIFLYELFQKKKKKIQEYHQRVKQLDPDQAHILSGLIWVQTVCKGYQQMTKVITSGESVKHDVSVSVISVSIGHCINLF